MKLNNNIVIVKFRLNHNSSVSPLPLVNKIKYLFLSKNLTLNNSPYAVLNWTKLGDYTLTSISLANITRQLRFLIFLKVFM